jgi:hypothetical protein
MRVQSFLSAGVRQEGSYSNRYITMTRNRTICAVESWALSFSGAYTTRETTSFGSTFSGALWRSRIAPGTQTSTSLGVRIGLGRIDNGQIQRAETSMFGSDVL